MGKARHWLETEFMFSTDQELKDLNTFIHALAMNTVLRIYARRVLRDFAEKAEVVKANSKQEDEQKLVEFLLTIYPNDKGLKRDLEKN